MEGTIVHGDAAALARAGLSVDRILKSANPSVEIVGLAILSHF